MTQAPDPPRARHTDALVDLLQAIKPIAKKHSLSELEAIVIVKRAAGILEYGYRFREDCAKEVEA